MKFWPPHLPHAGVVAVGRRRAPVLRAATAPAAAVVCRGSHICDDARAVIVNFGRLFGRRCCRRMGGPPVRELDARLLLLLRAAGLCAATGCRYRITHMQCRSSITSLSTSVSNPFVRVVANLSPSDLIGRFMSTAHPKVQEAVRTTILGLIGSLPKLAFETTTITTGERLASLMFQLQMTGYMFKNAEYRMSLSQSLKGVDSQPLLNGSGQPSETKIPKVTGKIKVKYSIEKEGGEMEINKERGGMEIEVEAEAYMSELRSEVREAMRKGVLSYPALQNRERANAMTMRIRVLRECESEATSIKKMLY
ncbi:hypothetical protein TL16_g04952 [Triparma laevis f. inornata]|uniref:Uncharacterized protein n=1 Tax=Triparma laevis f. inornata TaxID=1714386 RepID=A0A9W7ADJ7_9STRA|nr:hypothetical protein TL16_g04952 [Triparma laevis f. inornata]